MSWAIRFSKPSWRSFEKGRLLGSEQTRNGWRLAVGGWRFWAGGWAATANRQPPTANTASTTSLKREDIQHPSSRRCFLEVRHRVHESEGGGRVARVEIARDDRAGPAADPRHVGDVLLAVRAAVGHRRRDHARAELELPHQMARVRVDRLGPAVHRAVEDQ